MTPLGVFLIVVVILAKSIPLTLTEREIGRTLTFVANYWFLFPPVTSDYPLIQHLWTLAIEEQFYFFWPAILLLGWRAGRFVAIATILLSPVLRVGSF